MNQSLTLVSPVRHRGARLPAQLTQRLVLYHEELYRVPACYQTMRVAAGLAYVTQAGQDHILQGGQELQLDRAADQALVSGIGDEQVILELFDTQAASEIEQNLLVANG